MTTSQDKLHNATSIDALAISSLLTPNERLENALANSARNGLPRITISPLQGQYLAIQAQLIGAKNILEVGTLGGYSSIWFASTGAKVTSLEINPKHRDVAVENCKGLDVEIILGDASKILPGLQEKGEVYDMMFIDADWERQAAYFEWGAKLVRKGGCIYVDNVIRELLDEGAPVLSGQKDSLLTHVKKLKENGVKVRATTISTISGHKGNSEEMMDGFLVAIVE
ncbi:S-adenosyl-L-methionine-dependent methyltransferase [Tricladium varicosporioides]|nr:S-adenosyl-L-methionine-dependent methyltransferase [Hymenoscyphus varicosporioides]